MSQQIAENKQRKSKIALIRCNYCSYVWLARSNTPVLTCSSCRNHVIVRDNIIKTDISENQKQKTGGQIQ